MKTLTLKARVLSHESADDRTLAQMEHVSMGSPIHDGSETGEMSAAYVIVPGRGGYIFAVDAESAQYLWSYDPAVDDEPTKADIEAAIAADKAAR
jgi:hypothetical protein